MDRLVPVALDPEAVFELAIPLGPTFLCKYMSCKERDRFDTEMSKCAQAVTEAKAKSDTDAEALANQLLWELLSKYLRGWDRTEELTLDNILECLTPTQFWRLLALVGDDQKLSENHRKNFASPGSSCSGSSANGVPQAVAAGAFGGGR